MRCQYIAAAVLVSLLLSPLFVHAQNDKESFQQYRDRMRKEYSDYKKKSQEDFAAYRKKVNDEYAEFLKQQWTELATLKGIKPPEDTVPPVPPTVCPEEERDQKKQDTPVPFDEVVKVDPPKPQPEPIAPVEEPKPEPPTPTAPKPDTIDIFFYGTPIPFIVDAKPEFSTVPLDYVHISNSWKDLSSGQCEALLGRCLSVRKDYRLGDWAYLQFLDKLSTQLVGKEGNDATLLTAWLYCQSGYKMRLGRTKNKLYLMYTCEGIIYDNIYVQIQDDMFYVYKHTNDDTVRVCFKNFPNEKSMSLRMTQEMMLTHRGSSSRTLQSTRYPNMNVSTTVNSNIIDFYNSYPTGTLDENFGTRWAVYATTPMSDKVKQTLYPQLRRQIEGKSKLQAAEELLNFVQTAFVYEYDDKVWGRDRAFFAEETLFYPYADCEDRSILFSRLVRDLLGFKVVLIFYPGHLATAVRYEGQKPSGDYIHLPDGDYYISDPTYIGAPIGKSMPGMLLKDITVIPL